jgi:hypothetical protein
MVLAVQMVRDVQIVRAVHMAWAVEMVLDGAGGTDYSCGADGAGGGDNVGEGQMVRVQNVGGGECGCLLGGGGEITAASRLPNALVSSKRLVGINLRFDLPAVSATLPTAAGRPRGRPRPRPPPWTEGGMVGGGGPAAPWGGRWGPAPPWDGRGGAATHWG